MPHVRPPTLAGLLAGAVVLVTACSGPAPAEAPSQAGGAPTAVTPSSSDPASAEPGAPASTEAPPSPEPQASTGSEPSVEPRRSVETAPPKKLDEPARTAGAVVSVESVRATTVKASSPADRSGPGVLVRVKLVNPTGRTLDTRFVQVGLTDQTGTAATVVEGPPTRALDLSVRAGRSDEGTYAFLTDGARTGVVTVAVYVTSGQPVVTFRGRPS